MTTNSTSAAPRSFPRRCCQLSHGPRIDNVALRALRGLREPPLAHLAPCGFSWLGPRRLRRPRPTQVSDLSGQILSGRRPFRMANDCSRADPVLSRRVGAGWRRVRTVAGVTPSSRERGLGTAGASTTSPNVRAGAGPPRETGPVSGPRRRHRRPRVTGSSRLAGRNLRRRKPECVPRHHRARRAVKLGAGWCVCLVDGRWQKLGGVDAPEELVASYRQEWPRLVGELTAAAARLPAIRTDRGRREVWFRP